MSDHTKEPWSYRRADGIDSPSSEDYKIFSDDGALVAETFELIGKHRATDQHANARRIVACVNACTGISNDVLDAGAIVESDKLYAADKALGAAIRQRDELLGVLKACDLSEFPYAREIIAKVEASS